MIFQFAIDSEANHFCECIARDMVSRFSITEAEAVARINSHWQNIKIGGPEEIVYHEDEEFWSQDIYWGHDSYWWLSEKERKDKKLHPLVPKVMKNRN